MKHIPSQRERKTLTEQESFTEISQLEDKTFSKHLEPLIELPSSDIKPSRKTISRFKNELKKPKALVMPLLHAEMNDQYPNNEMNNEANPSDFLPATDIYDIQAIEDQMALLEQKEIEENDRKWEEHVNDDKLVVGVISAPQEEGTLQGSSVDKDLAQEGVVQTIRPVRVKDKKCNQCPQLFFRKDHLKRHIVFKHSQTKRPVQEKNKKCNQCDQLFFWKHSVKRHILFKHTQIKRPVQEKDKKCDQCDQLFSRKDNLKKHIILKHTQKRYLSKKKT